MGIEQMQAVNDAQIALHAKLEMSLAIKEHFKGKPITFADLCAAMDSEWKQESLNLEAIEQLNDFH